MSMKNNFKTELLAPAGKWESLVAAVQNGADAVYLGEQSFSARKNAANFSWEQIEEAVKYCHVRNVRVHLALNTLISDTELKEYEKSVIKAASTGVDALIIQDIGAAHLARSVCPEMELHASTQLTASNLYDVEYLQKIGFSRIVLSRELSFEEISHIHENTDAELEAFIHGALCISFSGKCLMSSFIGGRSGNRGMCAQPCRQKYTFNSKSGYFLSPRDLCLASELEKMCKAGITSFKIEGRMKSPEYVAAVTKIYRKYLDSFAPFEKEDEEYLKKIFVRGDGFTKGYFSSLNTPEIMNYSISNDNLSSRADASALKEAKSTFLPDTENKKIPVSASFSLFTNKPLSLSLNDGLNTVTVFGKEAEKANNTPLSESRVFEQISKMGQTPYFLENFSFSGDGISTVPISELNRIRRDGAEALTKKRAAITKKEVFPFKYPYNEISSPHKKAMICVEVRTKEQFEAAKEADRIIVPLSLWKEITPDEKCFVLLPEIIIDEEKTKKLLSSIGQKYGVYSSTPGILSVLKSEGRKTYANWGMNIYNFLSAHALKNICDGLTLSSELSLAQIEKISKSTSLPTEIICHGYQRVMTSRACLVRGITGKCDCREPLKITDKTGAAFTLLGDPDTHLNTVLNSRPTFMADKLKELYKSGCTFLRIVLSAENAQETKELIKIYRGEIKPVMPPLYTRGYLLPRR